MDFRRQRYSGFCKSFLTNTDHKRRWHPDMNRALRRIVIWKISGCFLPVVLASGRELESGL